MIAKVIRLLELLVCGPAMSEMRQAALVVSLPRLEDIDYELLGRYKSWNESEV